MAKNSLMWFLGQNHEVQKLVVKSGLVGGVNPNQRFKWAFSPIIELVISKIHIIHVLNSMTLVGFKKSSADKKSKSKGEIDLWMLTNWQVLAPEPISPTQSRKTAAAQRISEEPNIYIHIIYFQSEYLYSCVWSMIQNYYLRRVWDNVSFRMSLKSTFLAFKKVVQVVQIGGRGGGGT